MIGNGVILALSDGVGLSNALHRENLAGEAAEGIEAITIIMYADPFHVPQPDLVMFQETWDAGESFRSGSVWNLGHGRVYYFRPGHETFAVFQQPETLRIVENAVRWLAAEQRAARAQ